MALLELLPHLGGGRDDVHILAPASKAVNNGVEPHPENSSHEEYFGGNSRSLSNLTIDPTVWFESVVHNEHIRYQVHNEHSRCLHGHGQSFP